MLVHLHIFRLWNKSCWFCCPTKVLHFRQPITSSTKFWNMSFKIRRQWLLLMDGVFAQSMQPWPRYLNLNFLLTHSTFKFTNFACSHAVVVHGRRGFACATSKSLLLALEQGADGRFMPFEFENVRSLQGCTNWRWAFEIGRHRKR